MADEFGSFGVLVDGHAVFEVVWFGEEAAVFEDVVFDFVSEEAECGFSAPHGDDGEGDLVECLDGCGADGVPGFVRRFGWWLSRFRWRGEGGGWCCLRRWSAG